MTHVQRFMPITGRDWLWTCLAIIGLMGCLLLTGTFDTVLASLAPIASFDYRIAGTPLSGNTPVVATCAVCAIAAWNMHLPRIAGPAVGAVLSIAQALSCAAVVFGKDCHWASVTGWYTLQAAATVQLIFWAQTLSQVGRRRSLGLFACSLLLVCLVNLGEDVAGRGAIVALCLIGAVTSPLILSLFARETGRNPDLFGGQSQANTAAALETLPLSLSIASLALFGISMGSIQSNGGTGLANLENTFVSVQLTTVFVACALLVFAWLFNRLPNPDAMLRVFLLAVFVAAVYLVGVLGPSFAAGGILASSIARSAVFAYVWVLACEMLPHPTRAAFVFASGWGAFTLAHTVSTKFGLGIYGLPINAHALYNLLIVICLMALVSVTAYPQLRRDVAAIERPRSPSTLKTRNYPDVRNRDDTSEREEGRDRYTRGCALLAKRYELTAREAEVLLPLVRGRANSSIAAALAIGTETVRTHIRHIYQKTNIHSREELMDTVEALGRE